ncbi:hypothetical protein DIPPA_09569 [Diplonema papillatum]|nr:hypothetical protein DIPPA_09569 [Diplonema papillatum]
MVTPQAVSRLKLQIVDRSSELSRVSVESDDLEDKKRTANDANGQRCKERKAEHLQQLVGGFHDSHGELAAELVSIVTRQASAKIRESAAEELIRKHPMRETLYADWRDPIDRIDDDFDTETEFDDTYLDLGGDYDGYTDSYDSDFYDDDSDDWKLSDDSDMHYDDSDDQELVEIAQETPEELELEPCLSGAECTTDERFCRIC